MESLRVGVFWGRVEERSLVKDIEISEGGPKQLLFGGLAEGMSSLLICIVVSGFTSWEGL